MLSHPDALQAWDEIAPLIAHARECLLVLDYDGTLTPIVPDPAEAVLPNGAKELLDELRGIAGVHVAVVSGRALTDVRQRVGLDLTYAGNHGLEIEGPGIHFVDEGAAAMAGIVSLVCKDLQGAVAGFPGAFVEGKGLSVSVHSRRAPEEDEGRLAVAVNKVVGRYAEEIAVLPGSRILEIRPRVTSDKGTAARLILRSLGTESDVLPVCIGDDLTDEDMFRQFPKGITVRVGSCAASAAKYCLRAVPEVAEMLRRIRDLRRQGRRPSRRSRSKAALMRLK